MVVIAGGDGTVHAVVNGLGPHFPNVPLGVLPLGTGNDFCRTLAVPLDPVAAVEVLRDGRPRAIDVARVEGGRTGFMVNAATGGFSGRVASEVTSDLKEFWGPLAYLRGAVGPAAEPPRYRVTLRLDGGPPETFDALNVVVANGRTAAGGFPVAPTASPEDGKLDVVVVRPGDALDLSVLAARLMHGDYLTDENVTHRLARWVELDSDPPMPFSIDGEPSEGSRWVFTVVPGALRVLTGPDYRPAPPAEPAVEEDEPPTPVSEAPKGLGPRLFGLLAGLLLLVKRTPRGYALGLFLIAAAVLTFAWLASGVLGGRWDEWNRSVLLAVSGRTAEPRPSGADELQARTLTPLDRVALAVTWLGGGWGTLAVVGGLLAAFLARRRYLDAATLLAVYGGVLLLESVLKPLFAVARPELFEPLAPVGGFSFPSGHALRGVGIFGFLAGLLAVGRPAAWRWALAAVSGPVRQLCAIATSGCLTSAIASRTCTFPAARATSSPTPSRCCIEPMRWCCC